jgi:hypothetical protein
MAIARCDTCEMPKGRTRKYVVSTEPVGYPKSSTVCGTPGCENPALVWLNEDESAEFERGQRVFGFPTRAAKVRVQSLAWPYSEDGE